MPAEPPELLVADAPAWSRWLEANGESAEAGVWLVLAKKGVSEPTSLVYEQALEEALCHGWIDGQVRRRDELTFRQRFTPRRSRSVWSATNVKRVERLIEQGRMKPAGLSQVERARADGRWERAYAGPAAAEVPEDLARALASRPRARAMFEVLTSQNRYAIIYRLGSIKREETRARRLEEFVAMLERGETLYPQRRRAPGDQAS